MQCLDCRPRDMATTAVGICLGCGAAVCGEHAHVTAGGRQGPLLGAPRRFTRTVRCHQCGPA
ncbi:uncharacterized protein DUF2180 [Streptomyces capillispiralis]|uniref:Uncharacterized protein DUF2180 n=1 Tax=Streptomyces capillispiralis TaxID=68182 RepID=A0A561SGQ4_9ACTN|nr:uncharacterized protein DUF2180 [Streptomyces capillispiralis]